MPFRILLLLICFTTLLPAQDCSTLEIVLETVIPPSCMGTNDGMLEISVTGGTPPYAYAWADGAGLGEIRTALVTGTYTITVTDNEGCTVDLTIELTGPPSITIEQTELLRTSCNGNNDGGLRLLVGGGTPPYVVTYLGENYSTDGTDTLRIDNLFAGLNLLEVTDVNGCTQSRNVRILETSIDPFYTFERERALPCGEDSLLIRKPAAWGDAVLLVRLPGSPDLIAVDSVNLPAGNTFYRVEYGDGCQAAGGIDVEDITLTDNDLRIAIVDLGEENCNDTESYGVYDDANNPLQDTLFYDWQWFVDGVPVPGGNLWEQNVDRGQPLILSVEVISDCDTLRLSRILDQPIVCRDVSGKLILTAPGCDPLDSITPVPFAVVEMTDVATGDTYFTVTDSAGCWAANLPTASYRVRPVPPVGSPTENCLPLTEFTLGDTPETGLNLYLAATEVCPRLGTGITTARFRRCFPNRATVSYDNRGGATATGATLTVEMDEFFVDITADRPFTRDGQTLTFQLGDLPPFASGSIHIDFIVGCNSEFGQLHCLEATAGAGEDCSETDNWTGAYVTVTGGECVDNEVEFIIRNEGASDMTTDLEYIVVEDGIMMQPRPVVELPLDAGGQRILRFPANGSTYHVVAQQELLAPGARQPAAVAEGCGTNAMGRSSTGFGNLFALGNDLAATTRLCRENTGSYDPNEKLGFPMGLNGENDIEPGTRLTYDLYFQNTGTDTAFTVVVRDTLPLALDICSLKFESSSHAYRASLDSNRVLTFTFDNILLPDSTTNLAGSQGVVQFTIDHDPTLERGDRFRNRAGIYFDFNEPVITEWMNHRIAPEPVISSVRSREAATVSLSVYPNPTNGRINVDFTREGVRENASLVVTDLYGRELARRSVSSYRSHWELGRLPAGYYLLLLEDGGVVRGRSAFVVAR